MQLFGTGVRAAFIPDARRPSSGRPRTSVACVHHLGHRIPLDPVSVEKTRPLATMGMGISTHCPVHARSTILVVMQRWMSRRALLLHFEFLLLVAGCAAATWWQARRALGGNGLSWFYTFEWPILAGIAIAAWWHLIHEDPAERAARKRERALDSTERTAEW
jgi:hypothetical protein